jgi:hypothetical protein
MLEEPGWSRTGRKARKKVPDPLSCTLNTFSPFKAGYPGPTTQASPGGTTENASLLPRNPRHSPHDFKALSGWRLSADG